MTERLAIVPIDQLRPHPANPRRVAVADEALVASIASVGLIDRLLIAPDPVDPDTYLVLDGHRRLDGCRKAMVSGVPCRVRDDLVTVTQQLEVMILTGLQKELLTPVEEAAAYEQLVLGGMDVDSIAAATGYSARRIQQRMRLNALTDEARDHVHAGDATLTDVELLLEFVDDPDATARLEKSLGTPNYQLQVATERRVRRRREEQEPAAAELLAAGAIDLLRDFRFDTRALATFPEPFTDPAQHDGCLGFKRQEWAAGLDLYCIDVDRHDLPKPSAPLTRVDSEWERRRAEREARVERFAVAHTTRVRWLVEHYAAMFPTRTHQPLAAAARALLPAVIVGETVADEITIATALGHEAATYDVAERALTDTAVALPIAKPTQVLAAFACLLAAVTADQLNIQAEYVDERADTLRVLALWDWLTSAGYQLSDVDREQRTLIELRDSELAEDEAAS